MAAWASSAVLYGVCGAMRSYAVVCRTELPVSAVRCPSVHCSDPGVGVVLSVRFGAMPWIAAECSAASVVK